MMLVEECTRYFPINFAIFGVARNEKTNNRRGYVALELNISRCVSPTIPNLCTPNGVWHLAPNTLYRQESHPTPWIESAISSRMRGRACSTPRTWVASTTSSGRRALTCTSGWDLSSARFARALGCTNFVPAHFFCIASAARVLYLANPQPFLQLLRLPPHTVFGLSDFFSDASSLCSLIPPETCPDCRLHIFFESCCGFIQRVPCSSLFLLTPS